VLDEDDEDDDNALVAIPETLVEKVGDRMEIVGRFWSVYRKSFLLFVCANVMGFTGRSACTPNS